ncbi:SusC/RagA family TonB-linked outer membrane protein [Zunongwangia sp. HGR-M22]|uniref:SusC/RagA family TonB-linked outer membrane protein n=1 Tax=Zunongwangia sp. HGR-M22 TaxID=3015168 RepID=UPI0022DCF9D3|nr:SusC/RagA family TonB-linked outer membrane protein [Zunongwangia sp. HGR-M22]WBL24719.1 SusC/RagA family TonB-linked outer membrane protein [Zunongwangia sp. HGR-M22]
MKTNFRNYLTMFFLILSIGISNEIYAQDLKTISGTVSSEADGIPLSGVNIFVEGTNYATVSDFDGNFTIEAPSDATLTVSYIGFTTKTIEVDGRSTIDIQMQDDVQALSDVVVVGYGKVKKTDLTGSVGTVGGEDLAERNMTNPLEALQGNVPGVQISTSTGRIGDGFDITIRGKNSISGNVSPLYVVDGVPTNSIDFLNPQDIERMDILKDASSTAIYGSRGSNGVVIISTKDGAGAKAGFNVSFDNFVGVREVTRLPELMSPEKWWRYHQSAYLPTAAKDPLTGTVTPETLRDAVSAGGQNDELFRRVVDGESFDWYDEVLQTGIQQNHYLNVSGRSDNGVGYNLGLGYQKETGNIENESLEKYTLKLGINHQVTDKVSYGTNLTITLLEQNFGSDVAMRDAFRLNPYLSPYGLDGELYPLPGKLQDNDGNFLINKTSTYNPILNINNTTDVNKSWNILSSTYFQYDPLEWLELKTTFSTGIENYRIGRSWGAQTAVGIDNDNLPSAQIQNGENFNYTWDNQFNISKTFNEDHNINLLGLFSLYSAEGETSSQSARRIPFETKFYNIGSGDPGTYDMNSNYQKQTLASYALRANYSLMDKYLVTASARWDGSSLLADNWDSFFSGAFAWKLKQENFLKDVDAISTLKLRVSYGFTGNNIIAPYSTINTLDSRYFYDFGGQVTTGWVPGSLANPFLKWEKTREVNFGIDFGFLNNRIEGSVDYYDKLSDDLLLEQQLPLESGWDNITANIGSVSNKGVEIALTTRNIQTSDFNWTTNFTFTRNVNAIESIYGQDQVDDIGNNLFIGESIDAHYNYKFNGIWQADEVDEAAGYGMEEGQEKLVDVNNDGRYTPEDRIILGSSNPDWSGSLFTNFRYKNWDLSASLITNQGVLVYSNFHSNFADVRDRGRQKLDVNWYIPENDAGIPAQVSNTYPQARNEGSFWRNDGVGYYHDASFVKVKNIGLGYNISDKMLDNLNLKKLRVYANVLNPFVFTDYEGYDPEWAGASLNTGRPSSVTYQLGFNLNF